MGKQVSLRTELEALVNELDQTHRGAFSWSTEDGFPEFSTAENGLQRHFTKKARESLWRLSSTLHQNRDRTVTRIELGNYQKYVRQAIADLHASEALSGSPIDNADNGNDPLVRLRNLVEERVANSHKAFTHYFPAWTLGIEPFALGPVEFLSRTAWIDSVDFHQRAKDHFLNQPEANYRWREILKEAFEQPNGKSVLDGLAGPIYGAIQKCPTLIKVTIQGYEQEFSRKLARLVCKTALDAISLGIGPRECFLQQALQDERLPPVGNHSLVETDGFLWLPGTHLGHRIPGITPQRMKQSLKDMAEILQAFAAILAQLVNPSHHPHPNLANRWATALDWYGEGCRESSDAIAVAKLGTCLDVLCCGGKKPGILKMVVHLTDTPETTEVVSGIRPRTLKQLVEDIYEHGRSQILHGNHYDRLEPFATEREHSAYLARITLIMAAVRLQHYSGPDDDKAFRTI